MMHFDLKAIALFIEDHVIPQEHLLLTQQYEALESAMQGIRKEVKDRNWWSTLPTQDMALSMHEMGLLSEVVGRSPLGHYAFGFQAPDIGNMELMAHFASPEIQQRWLEPLQQGDIRSCFAMTEPDSPGSNPTMMITEAVMDGDDWVINGRKWFTTAADGAAFCIVMAKTHPDADKHHQASMILVPANTSGFRIIRNVPVMGHAGAGYFSHAEVAFEQCRVPISHTIGSPGEGFKLAQHRLGPGRVHHCMRWLGVAQRCFEIMCHHVKNRPITATRCLADQDLIKTKVAQCYAKIQAARAVVINTAQKIDAQGFEAARYDVSMIKFHCAEMLTFVIDHALQCLGAAGVSDDHIVAFYYREERAARIYDGPDEVHMLSLGKQILTQ